MEQPNRALMEGGHLGPAIRWLGPCCRWSSPLAIVTVAYFAAAGALDELVEGAVLLRVTGTVRRDRVLGDHVGNIVEIVRVDFGISALLVAAGPSTSASWISS